MSTSKSPYGKPRTAASKPRSTAGSKAGSKAGSPSAWKSSKPAYGKSAGPEAAARKGGQALRGKAPQHGPRDRTQEDTQTRTSRGSRGDTHSRTGATRTGRDTHSARGTGARGDTHSKETADIEDTHLNHGLHDWTSDISEDTHPVSREDTRPARNRDDHRETRPRYDPSGRQEAQGPDLVFGLHAVEAVLKHHHNSVDHLLVLEGRDDPRMESILARAQRVNVRVETVVRARLDEQANGVHQGVIAVCRQLHLERSEAQLKELLDTLEQPPFLLVLDGVTDPHNLGACLRSAEAAGVHGVIVPKDKSSLLNATARKVACGAAEVIPFFAVTNLVRTLKTLQEAGVWIYGAAGEATASIYQTDLRGPAALVMGSEGTGMRRLTRESCDALFAIPMAGEVSSLNVSVSAGICLFEAVRQRSDS